MYGIYESIGPSEKSGSWSSQSSLKFVSCDKMFKLERDLELSEL